LAIRIGDDLSALRLITEAGRGLDVPFSSVTDSG